MEREILDEILEYLLFIQNAEKPYQVGFHERDHYFEKYNDSFFRAAINKLIKDEYLSLGNNVKITHITPRFIAGLCDITFEGILFITSGGYKNQTLENSQRENALNNLQAEQRKQSAALVTLNRWIVLGAVIVAVDSILNILKFFDVTYQSIRIFTW